MKITGLIIIRNAVLNDYPVVEAISSILPVVDEMIVSIDKGNDNTEDLVRSIPSDKIRIYYSSWDMSQRQGGKVYADETNKALQHVSVDTDWIFYIQADEVVHEKYHPEILNAAAKYKNNKNVDGLLFGYLHFYGTYSYVADNRGWYDCEVRIIKNDPAIRSYKDAQGFRRGEEKINVVKLNAEVYHYGWVKSPAQMKEKMNRVAVFYKQEDAEVERMIRENDLFDFDHVDYLRSFGDTHPAVMQKRIAELNWSIKPGEQRRKISFKNRVLRIFERLAGRRLFVFKNYKLVRK